MFNLTRKNLTPDQMKRANITTCITVTIVHLFCIYITIMSDKSLLEKIAFIASYATLFTITAVYVYKNVTKRSAEIMIAIGFCISFGIISYIMHARVMMIIFPVLLSLAVYLNEYLIIWGTGATLVFVITKIIVVMVQNPPNKADELNTINLVLICLIICVFGGCKAIKKLIQFSNEETDAVAAKVEKQLEIARDVDSITQNVNEQFTKVREDLQKITESINNTQEAMSSIADGTEVSAKQSTFQSEKTIEIQSRLGNTNDVAENALDTTKRLQQVVLNGKEESDVLEEQSINVDKSIVQISDTIKKLVEHVGKVSEITDVIISISGQTNLLALNASIEAARAGDAGRGFAVVADQIRNLAEMTKSSTEQITQIMNELSSITEDTQKELANTVESIAVQREKVNTVHESFVAVENDINALVGNMMTVSNEVSAVLDANSAIVDGIETLSGITQEISASTAVTKSEMSDLQSRVSNFSAAVDSTSDSLEELKKKTAMN